jgi:hypothetical protein
MFKKIFSSETAWPNGANVANQKQELPLVSIFVGGTERNGETL